MKLPILPPRYFKLLQQFCITAAVILLGALCISVIKSGYLYQFDIDELFYAQRTYLFAHGYRPYLDVYTLTYPPTFETLMKPVFTLAGYSFSGIFAARKVMIGLFFLRMIALFLFAKNIFNKRTAFLFLFLALLDPFIVLTGMQYRPDNLMMLLFSLGLMTLSFAVTKKKEFLYFIGGILLTSSILSLPKVVPFVAIVTLSIYIQLFMQKKVGTAIKFTTGLLLPALLFGTLLIVTGEINQAIQQIFVDTKLLYSHFTNPINIYFFNGPENIWIFGASGRPSNWLYAWALPFMGAAGVYHVLYSFFKEKKTESTLLRFSIAAALPFQWLPLFYLQAVFIQHYMPVNWAFALCAAFAIIEILDSVKKYPFASISISTGIGITIAVLTFQSFQYNTARSTIQSDAMIAKYEKRWEQIPENEVVFPGYLFRKQLYPVPYGSPLANFSAEVFQRLPDIPTILAKNNPERIFIDEYSLNHFLQKDQDYIRSHYQRVTGDDEMMNAIYK